MKTVQEIRINSIQKRLVRVIKFINLSKMTGTPCRGSVVVRSMFRDINQLNAGAFMSVVALVEYREFILSLKV